MRRALLERARYDWATHEATRKRNAEQIKALPAPRYPATGTARISALLAHARRRRDEALLRGAGSGAGGFCTHTPLDNAIGSDGSPDRAKVDHEATTSTG